MITFQGKWCTCFNLLGLQFDINRNRMFGKITVTKTFLLSKISHISAVLLTPFQSQSSIFDKDIYKYIRGWNPEGDLKPNIVTEDILYVPNSTIRTRYAQTQRLLGCIEDVLATKMQKDSTWKTIDVKYVGRDSFVLDIFTKTEDSLTNTLQAQVESSLKRNICKFAQVQT